MLISRQPSTHNLVLSSPWCIAQVASFNGCADLLRASRLNSVLRKCGRILLNSKGSGSTYSLSEPVPRIGYFLSHNWSVSRFRKFLGLSYYFNMNCILLCFILVSASLSVCVNRELVPLIRSAYSGEYYGYFCRLFCIPVSILAWLVFFDASAWLGFKGPFIFLDKTCIHQEDTQIQRQGIEKLAAFLKSSDRMVVLYSTAYTQKLWTVYEMASFLTLRGSDHVDVVALHQVVTHFGVFCILWVNGLMNVVAMYWIPQSPMMWYAIDVYFGAFVYCYFHRSWIRERASMYERLRTFDVKDCVCAVESDRPLVYKNIHTLMKSAGKMCGESEADALKCFNGLVRAELPKVFGASLGHLSFKYRIVVMALSLYFVPGYIDKLPMHASPRKAVWQLVGVIFACTGTGPICVYFFECFAKHYLHLSGWADVLYVLGAYHVGCFLPAVMSLGARYMAEKEAMASTTVFYVGIALQLGFCCLVALAYAICSKKCCSSRKDSDPSSAHDCEHPDPKCIMETE
eukprot:TRINITY_DN7801_c0_g1_i2.p1 TRINITY_DN7801_c0_g1~~TRINITY_DN7801_c0_g1_i2.p1  ORF type:complete len:515 (+),score=47.31 TRINITY_DN7801_c0_g1_i2:47-1591(+)